MTCIIHFLIIKKLVFHRYNNSKLNSAINSQDTLRFWEAGVEVLEVTEDDMKHGIVLMVANEEGSEKIEIIKPQNIQAGKVYRLIL